MSRYTKRPRAWVADQTFDNEFPLVADISVDEHVATFTGLLDADGDEIWIEPRPIGFGRDEEW
jgi:hypothetical protein